jgi:hypothetical protein
MNQLKKIYDEEGDNREEIIANLTESFKQIKLIKEGKLKGRPVEEFLNKLE